VSKWVVPARHGRDGDDATDRRPGSPRSRGSKRQRSRAISHTGLRADLLAKLCRREEARWAYEEAIARERDGAIIRFLSERRAKL
jgi:hypothetical protein